MIIQVKPQSGGGKIQEIDFMRGIAIILMIIGHSFIVTPVDISSESWCQITHEWIYSFHMELFFLLSGCVYKCGEYGNFIKKKFNRIMVPYLFFGIIALVLHSTNIGAVNRHAPFVEGLYKLLFEGGSFWFLYTLFSIFLFYPLIENIYRNPIIDYLLILCVITIRDSFLLSDIFCVTDFFYYLPYFIIGKNIQVYLGHRRSNAIDFVIFVTGCLMLVFIDSSTFPIVNYDAIRYLKAMAIIAVLYGVAVGFIFLANKWGGAMIVIKSFLEVCSKYSLQLYLLNGFVMVPARIVICNVLHITNSFAISMGIVVSNLAVTLVFCSFILPRTRWLAWLCGTKNTRCIK